jgi:hypothetical protein
VTAAPGNYVTVDSREWQHNRARLCRAAGTAIHRLSGGGLRRRSLLLRHAFYGSEGGQKLDAPIVGMAFDPDTGGYWGVASDGGIFSFNAPFQGSEGGKLLDKPMVGICPALIE